VFKKLKKLFISKKNAGKWRLNIYVFNQHVKKLYIDEAETPLNRVYVCSIWFKKHLFKTNKTQVVLRPMKILYIDPIKKELHVEAILFEGGEIK